MHGTSHQLRISGRVIWREGEEGGKKREEREGGGGEKEREGRENR